MAYKSTISLLLACVALLSGCENISLSSPVKEAPKISTDTESAKLLKSLPAAREKTVVSVYDFQDQTGQLKPNDNFANYSRAVTQGGLSLLNKALLQAGNGSWFTVVERGGLKNLLQERQIIQMTRAQYSTPDGQKLGPLPPMFYAGMLIEGGVVGYDSNIITGGAGANYLGVGGDIKYRRDVVTIDLRAINIANGEVLLSITAEKTLYSTAVNGNAFKFVSFSHLLQMETGYTLNEPPQLAVRQAIEMAVYSMIMEGARKNLWQFSDEIAGRKAIADYMQLTNEETNSIITASNFINATLPKPIPENAEPSYSSDNQISPNEINKTDHNNPNQPLQHPPVPLAPKKL